METKELATTEKGALAIAPTPQTLFLQTLIDSRKLPAHIKTVADAFTVAQMGKELGFPTMQAFHYIIPIDGRLSLSAKAINALLRRGGVKMKTIEDGLYVWEDGTTSKYNPRPNGKAGEKPLDRRTIISFVRDGVEETCEFTWKDAVGQGLDTKLNWKRMPKEMLYARCLSKGANRIGADLMMGLYMTDELADAFRVDEKFLLRDEDGFIEEIIDQHAADQRPSMEATHEAETAQAADEMAQAA